MKWNLNSKRSVHPPNSLYYYLSHPGKENEDVIQLATFFEHRYAFYFWTQWRQTSNLNCDLVSLDWHQDLCYPGVTTQKELELLNLENPGEISRFSWARLSSNNDNHILSAAYLNQINDIWVVCKQHMDFQSQDEFLTDCFGNRHTIRKFKTPGDLLSELSKSKVQKIYLDIDLDYFTIENSTSNSNHHFTYESDEFIANWFSLDSKLMKWLLQRIQGITIALEPIHCGGISKSLKYLSIIEELWFNQSLGHGVEWKHLHKS